MAAYSTDRWRSAPAMIAAASSTLKQKRTQLDLKQSNQPPDAKCNVS